MMTQLTRRITTVLLGIERSPTPLISVELSGRKATSVPISTIQVSFLTKILSHKCQSVLQMVVCLLSLCNGLTRILTLLPMSFKVSVRGVNLIDITIAY